MPNTLIQQRRCYHATGHLQQTDNRPIWRHRHTWTSPQNTRTPLPCNTRSTTVTQPWYHDHLKWTTWNTYLSSTLPEIDPDTAYVVCISVSLGFRQKPSDTALLSVIALTTFNCIVSASVTKGVLVCFVVTVHWWRHRTHYDVTEAYRVLRNILTVDLNNGATRADLRGIPKHYEATAKAGR